jgi:hypothetical protein
VSEKPSGGADSQKGEVGIGEILRNAWWRLVRKQLLFLYPLALGLFGYLAFFAVYSALDGRMSWDRFARAAESRRDFLTDHLDTLTSPSIGLAVALTAGLLIVLLNAAIRIPYYRAVLGFGYPLAPRSVREVLRLSSLYLVIFAVFYVVPLFLPLEEGTLFTTVAVLIILLLQFLVILADYAAVFEELGPVEALLRSVRLLRRGWALTLGVFLLGYLLLDGIHLLYEGYFEGAQRVFPLFPFSKIFLEALVIVVLDVFLLHIYRYLAHRSV